MVLEQVLTIFFALGVGAAIVIYAARPRHGGASITPGPSTIATFAPAEVAQPAPEVTAIETTEFTPPITETLTTAEVAPAVTEAAVASTEIAPVATGPVVQAPAAQTATAVAVIPARRARSTRRAQRKSSTTRRSRAKSGATTGSS